MLIGDCVWAMCRGWIELVFVDYGGGLLAHQVVTQGRGPCERDVCYHRWRIQCWLQFGPAVLLESTRFDRSMSLEAYPGIAGKSSFLFL